MEIIRCLILCFLATCAAGGPVAKNIQPLSTIPFIAKRDGSSACQEMEVFAWTNDFHECFIDRKYGDGGRYLNSIVDRILDHGEDCMERSSRECRPDFKGFTALMNKTIWQIKDYAFIYLEEIHKGRENINDLECVETILNIKTYDDCFRDIVNQAHVEPELVFQNAVKKGIQCTNRENRGCSEEAKTALNRIVRIVLGVEQPFFEDFKEEIKPNLEVFPEKSKPNSEESEEEMKTSSEEFEDKFKPNFQDFEDIKPTPAPAPMMWYDYLAYPFVQVYKWVASWFG